MAESQKARSSFLKLLSEPGFNFAPYFDQAVLEWLERNIGTFLQQEPTACKYFLQERDFRHAVAGAIPLDNEKDVIEFLATLKGGWDDRQTISAIGQRLVEAKKADLIVHVDNLQDHTDETFVKVVEAMSEEGATALFEKILLNNARFHEDVYGALIKKLPPSVVKEVQPERWYNADKKSKARGVAALAEKWPIEDIASFLQKYGTKYSSMCCMNCGEKEAKSKPGYTLHRKTCDPKDMYPNIWTTVARRTL